METLKNRVLVEGRALGNGILKVDGFINHQIDTHLMIDVGQDLAEHFVDANVTKVITAEISGIAPALATAQALSVPVIYARKTRPVTMTGPVLVEVAPSHTKGRDVFLMISWLQEQQSLPWHALWNTARQLWLVLPLLLRKGLKVVARTWHTSMFPLSCLQS